MLSISKTKVCKNYIYIKKHPISVYSLEEISKKFAKSKDKVLDMTNFYLEQLNFDKIRFIIRLCCNSDGKTALNINQVRDYISQLISEAIENFLSNPMESNYISENIIVSVTSYGGKHQLCVSPRIDFTK